MGLYLSVVNGRICPSSILPKHRARGYAEVQREETHPVQSGQAELDAL
jgi:hypothetical protein